MEYPLTIFTPAYNRAYTIHKCYESLLRQTRKDFVWLIVDDGSTDNTKELIDEWIKEGKLNIRYFYQENQGMHGAHNTAYEKCDTLLCTCCDSDDFMDDRAVENILGLWESHATEKHMGIVCKNVRENGEPINELPTNVTELNMYELYYKYKLKGDVKLVHRTALMKKNPYPIIKGEKYLSIGYKYYQYDKDYKLLVLNKPVCFVEYMADGQTSNKIEKYVKSPKGFVHCRLEMMKALPTFSSRLIVAIKYVSAAIFAKDKDFLKKSPCKIETIIAIPAGILWNIKLRIRYKKWLKTKLQLKK